MQPPLPPDPPLPPLPPDAGDGTSESKKAQVETPQNNYWGSTTDWQNYWNQNYASWTNQAMNNWTQGYGPWGGMAAAPVGTDINNYNAWNQYWNQATAVPGMTPGTENNVDKKDANEFDESRDPELIEFDVQFRAWEEQFVRWKEENKDHPDKNALTTYEETWTQWRTDLLNKRQDIKKSKQEQMKNRALFTNAGVQNMPWGQGPPNFTQPPPFASGQLWDPNRGPPNPQWGLPGPSSNQFNQNNLMGQPPPPTAPKQAPDMAVPPPGWDASQGPKPNQEPEDGMQFNLQGSNRGPEEGGNGPRGRPQGRGFAQNRLPQRPNQEPGYGPEDEEVGQGGNFIDEWQDTGPSSGYGQFFNGPRTRPPRGGGPGRGYRGSGRGADSLGRGSSRGGDSLAPPHQRMGRKVGLLDDPREYGPPSLLGPERSLGGHNTSLRGRGSGRAELLSSNWETETFREMDEESNSRWGLRFSDAESRRGRSPHREGLWTTRDVEAADFQERELYMNRQREEMARRWQSSPGSGGGPSFERDHPQEFSREREQERGGPTFDRIKDRKEIPGQHFASDFDAPDGDFEPPSGDFLPRGAMDRGRRGRGHAKFGPGSSSPGVRGAPLLPDPVSVPRRPDPSSRNEMIRTSEKAKGEIPLQPKSLDAGTLDTAASKKASEVKPEVPKSEVGQGIQLKTKNSQDPKDLAKETALMAKGTANVLALFKQKVQEGGGSIPGLDLPPKEDSVQPSVPVRLPGKRNASRIPPANDKDGMIDVKFVESRLNIGPIGVPQDPVRWKPPGEWYDDEDEYDQQNSSPRVPPHERFSARNARPPLGKRGLEDDPYAYGSTAKVPRFSEGSRYQMDEVQGRYEGSSGGHGHQGYPDQFGPPHGSRGRTRGLLRDPPGVPRDYSCGGARQEEQRSHGGFREDHGGHGAVRDHMDRDHGAVRDHMDRDHGAVRDHMDRDHGGHGAVRDHMDRGSFRGRNNSTLGRGARGRGRGGVRHPEALMDIDFTRDSSYRPDEFYEAAPLEGSLSQRRNGGQFFEVGASETYEEEPPIQELSNKRRFINYIPNEGDAPHLDDVSGKEYDYRGIPEPIGSHLISGPTRDIGLTVARGREKPPVQADNVNPEEKAPFCPMVPPVRRMVPIDDLLSIPGRFMRPPKLVIILRGLPGAGKSTLAKMIKNKEVENGGSAPRILCLDDYFMVESEKLVTDPETGRKVKTKVMEYEFEQDLEENYRSALIKSFKKQVDEKFFPFIIIDCVNAFWKNYKEICEYSKKNDFEVYIGEVEMEAQTCYQRNIHSRSYPDLQQMALRWEKPPPEFIHLDLTEYIQDADIQEVKMEDCLAQEESVGEGRDLVELKSDDDDDLEAQTFKVIKELMRSKWDGDHTQEENLDKLDGIRTAKKRMGQSKPQSIDDWLQLSECFKESKAKPGKKTVRWADIEERREQLSARHRGFVVGQTDWQRMTDPTLGSSALVQIRYIEPRENKP